MDAKKEIDELVEKLNEYSKAYYKDAKPVVSDSEYDRLYDKLVALEQKYPQFKSPISPTTRVGDDTMQGFEEVEHTIPVLSLDKAYSIGELDNFRTRVAKAVDSDDLSFVLEEKIDGLSVVIYYENGEFKRAVTRGNGSVGSDVSDAVKTIRSVPLLLPESIDIAVRGEIYLPHEAFEKINKTLDEPYSNARNLAAGLLKRKKTSEIAGKGLDIFVYEGFGAEERCKNHMDMLTLLKDLGFRTNPHVIFIDKQKFGSLDYIINAKAEERNTLGYDIDGLVLKVDQFNYREALGFTEHHPRWAIAYKFESPVAKSILRRIDIQVGRTGRITPVAVFDKTFLLGSYIENASLHNKGYIEDMEIAIGDEISFSKRGDVIPQVEEVLEKNTVGNSTYKFPEQCPCCGSKLVDVGKNTFCLNESCTERILGEASFFVSKDAMDIEGVGTQTIKDLFSLGLLKDYTDIYYIDYDKELYGKEDYKEKKIENIKKGIALSKEKPFSSVLVALQIPNIGKKTAQLLIDAGFDSMNKLMALAKSNDTEKIASINQFGEKMAEDIIATLRSERFCYHFRRLSEAGLSMQAKLEDNIIVSDKLAGQVWCVTGSIDGYKNPELALEEVRKHSARIVSSVSSKTTHLLVGSKPGSKLQKAIANGKTRIIKQEDFADFLKSLE